MLGHRELSVDDYLGILRRRKWLLIIPAVLAPIIAFSVSLTIPDQYTSQTLVLVEQQRVPEAYVRSVVTDILSQRLATMQEQILSRSRLQPIIERFGLYASDADKVPMEDLVGRLRQAIRVTPVQPLSRSRDGSLLGFYITFTSHDPRTAQQVCTEITSMFIEENLKGRADRADSTTRFLQKQLDDAKIKLDEHDQRLAAFKSRYIGQLPGQEQTNLNILMGLNTQLEATTQVLNRAQQDKTYLESLIAQQISAWQSSSSGTNPDVLEQQLARLQNDLVTLRARYSDDHPDVKKMKNDIAQLQAKIDEANARRNEPGAEKSERARLTEPPEIQNMRVQLHNLNQTIQQKAREQERLQAEIKTYQARVQLSPVVEQQFKELNRDYETALAFYNDLLSKKTESEMATDLERRQQGEQFRVMDAANLPERPSYPDRRIFAGGGLAGGLALGLGIALLLEMRDKSLRSEQDVEFFLQLPTLAMVPVVGTEHNGRKKGFLARRREAKAAKARAAAQA
jgi:polysaccharide chain length determinant protein (PEP-CTERM system associated)